MILIDGHGQGKHFSHASLALSSPSILRILAMLCPWYDMDMLLEQLNFLLFKLANGTDIFNKGHWMCVNLNNNIAGSSYRNSEISYTTKKQYQYLSTYSLAIAMTSHIVKKEAWPNYMPSGSDVIRSHYYPLTSGIDIPPSYWLLAIDVIRSLNWCKIHIPILISMDNGLVRFSYHFVHVFHHSLIVGMKN